MMRGDVPLDRLLQVDHEVILEASDVIGKSSPELGLGATSEGIGNHHETYEVRLERPEVSSE